ncbi:uncharacterized protein LOC128960548 [Oppia nitens]|uniref:uncharacterized protein LOC128960548 n=1 Tax=Oppia nitens TaxID=1686743 RepID=UPI0023DC6585|nr:uncharacterized protein LOC128960548 [Oppia nitens]
MIKECRICLEKSQESDLISPCNCKGTVGSVHFKCLSQWIHINKQNSSPGVQRELITGSFLLIVSIITMIAVFVISKYGPVFNGILLTQLWQRNHYRVVPRTIQNIINTYLLTIVLFIVIALNVYIYVLMPMTVLFVTISHWLDIWHNYIDWKEKHKTIICVSRTAIKS